jgi:hypothetical protein
VVGYMVGNSQANGDGGSSGQTMMSARVFKTLSRGRGWPATSAVLIRWN